MKDLFEMCVGVLAFGFIIAWAILPYVIGAWIVLKFAGVI